MEIIKIASVETEKAMEKKEKRNISLFLWGKFVSLVGTNMYSFAMSLYVLQRTGSGTSFAMNLFLGTLPRVILGPIAGVLADRVERRKMVVGMDILSGLTILVLLPISYLYGLQIPFIYANTFLLSIINTFFTVSISASLPNLVRKESLMKINSYNQAAQSVSSILSPILAGVIYYILPIYVFIALNGVTFILSAISEMFIDFNLSKEAEEDKNDKKLDIRGLFNDLKSGFMYFKGQKALFTLIKFSVVLNFFVTPCMSVVVPFIINNVLSLSEVHYGLIEGSFSVGALMSSLIISRLPEREEKLRGLLIGTGLSGIVILLMALPVFSYQKLFSDNAYAAYYMIAMVLFSVLLMIINIPIMVLIQKLTPDQMMGRVMSWVETLATGIVPLGIIFMGIVIDYLPVYYPVIASGIMFLALTFLMGKSEAMKDL